MSKNVMTLKSGLNIIKVIKTDKYRSATYNFLLTFHSNHGPISHRFPDRQRFLSKIAKFSHPCVFYAPPLLTGFLLELGIGAMRQKLK